MYIFCVTSRVPLIRIFINEVSQAQKKPNKKVSLEKRLSRAFYARANH